MKNALAVATAFGLLTASGFCALAQTSQNPAMNAPDQTAWQLFIQANTRAGGTNSLFETWASDTDTFQMTPQFPTAPAPLALRRTAVPNIGRDAAQRAGRLLPAVPPGIGASEETRRNKVAHDFIVQNNLYKITGLRAAFGKEISFPVDSIEVKANWVPVSQIAQFTNNRVAAAQAPQLYHVNTGSDGNQWALVAMHVISKLVPNWTWATFEHQFNPARCDIIGCKDLFGAQTPIVAPNPSPQGYPPCTKTPALTAMLAAANIDPVYANYCLKGSQTDFTDTTGLAIRVGNSVTESGFVDQASCITCHSRAAWDATGKATTTAGFDDNGNAPLGALQPSWYWSFNSQPPIFQGMPGLKRIATSADFVWSIPFCVVDDTVTPPVPSQFCIGK